MSELTTSTTTSTTSTTVRRGVTGATATVAPAASAAVARTLGVAFTGYPPMSIGMPLLLATALGASAVGWQVHAAGSTKAMLVVLHVLVAAILIPGFTLAGRGRR